MDLRHSLLPLVFCLTVITAQADNADDIRKSLPTLKGDALINAYGQLYVLSLEKDDIGYQLRCVNDYIAEAHRQGNRKQEGLARLDKMTLLYNNDLNDSIYDQLPLTMQYMESIKDWKLYYETWSLLIDTYNFDGKTILGMDEAKKMITHAEQQQNQYGIGLGHYALGMVYAMMHNHEEAAAAYKKSIDIMLKQEPKPMQLSVVFSYYTEVLDILKRYETMNAVNKQWRQFLMEYYDYGNNDKNQYGRAHRDWQAGSPVCKIRAFDLCHLKRRQKRNTYQC